MSADLKSPTPQAKRQSFSEFLENLGIDFTEEVAHEMNELIHIVTETGKAGGLTLEFKFKPVGKGVQIEVSNEIKVKKPKQAREVNILFANQDNGLQRTDPRQRTLDGVRSVAEEKKAVRVVG